MNLHDLLEPTLEGLGYEMVDLELSNHGRMLRLFIDKQGGVTVDDCAFVSRHLIRLLAVENVNYDRLEVSSPGLDRPLRKAGDFDRFAGERAKVHTRMPVDGQKNFTGILRGVRDDALELEADGRVLRLALANVDKARLFPGELFARPAPAGRRARKG
ncbi:MAG TPA: ribosome maturation factor RimP [Burkholderiales bacterium]